MADTEVKNRVGASTVLRVFGVVTMITLHSYPYSLGSRWVSPQQCQLVMKTATFVSVDTLTHRVVVTERSLSWNRHWPWVFVKTVSLA